MKIKFSIITVVLDDIQGLKKTYASLLRQSNKTYEWIVKDGGSKDEAIEFLESLSDKVKWVSQKDNGIYDAMNHGIALSSGDYVVFMNAGDVFHDSEVLANVAEAVCSSEQETGILFGGAKLSFPQSGHIIYRPPRRSEVSLWHGLPANHQATYYQRNLLERTRYDLQYPLCGDYFLTASLLKNGAASNYIDKPLAIFEVGGQSYKKIGQLFAEPYRIQRDVLGIPLHYRLASAIKRFVSTAGFIVLSQSIFFMKIRKGNKK